MTVLCLATAAGLFCLPFDEQCFVVEYGSVSTRPRRGCGSDGAGGDLRSTGEGPEESLLPGNCPGRPLSEHFLGL